MYSTYIGGIRCKHDKYRNFLLPVAQPQVVICSFHFNRELCEASNFYILSYGKYRYLLKIMEVELFTDRKEGV